VSGPAVMACPTHLYAGYHRDAALAIQCLAVLYTLINNLIPEGKSMYMISTTRHTDFIKKGGFSARKCNNGGTGTMNYCYFSSH
jgi:hypothetical protein